MPSQLSTKQLGKSSIVSSILLSCRASLTQHPAQKPGPYHWRKIRFNRLRGPPRKLNAPEPLSVHDSMCRAPTVAIKLFDATSSR